VRAKSVGGDTVSRCLVEKIAVGTIVDALKPRILFGGAAPTKKGKVGESICRGRRSEEGGGGSRCLPWEKFTRLSSGGGVADNKDNCLA